MLRLSSDTEGAAHAVRRNAASWCHALPAAAAAAAAAQHRCRSGPSCSRRKGLQLGTVKSYDFTRPRGSVRAAARAAAAAARCPASHSRAGQPEDAAAATVRAS
jgi:hypothetical protein